MVARGNLQSRQRRLEKQLTGLDVRVLAVYERMHARELTTREHIFSSYPAFLVSAITDRQGERVHTALVRRWLREVQVFAFVHRRHYYFPAFEFAAGEPKPIVRELLQRARPLDGWHAMSWFVAANGWLEDAAPVDLMDHDPEAVVQAADHANDLVSD